MQLPTSPTTPASNLNALNGLISIFVTRCSILAARCFGFTYKIAKITEVRIILKERQIAKGVC